MSPVAAASLNLQLGINKFAAWHQPAAARWLCGGLHFRGTSRQSFCRAAVG
jgi:hypothetical protein